MRQQHTQHQVLVKNSLLNKPNRDAICNHVESYYCSVPYKRIATQYLLHSYYNSIKCITH